MKNLGLMLFGAALLAGTALPTEQSFGAVIRPVPDLNTLTADADVLVSGHGSIDLDVNSGFTSPTTVFFGGAETPQSFNVDGANGAQVTISGLGDTDPFLNFAIAVTDLGTPSSFTFVFSIPAPVQLVGLQILVAS